MAKHAKWTGFSQAEPTTHNAGLTNLDGRGLGIRVGYTVMDDEDTCSADHQSGNTFKKTRVFHC